MWARGPATLAREAECESVQHAGVGEGEGRVSQLPCVVSGGRGEHDGEAWIGRRGASSCHETPPKCAAPCQT